ncbi:hypothetical protein M758_1G019600 [Ceratodon purpureus]|nr:hypothetical protein M758_1G019600 [Ceratodon purpureus]
MCKHCQQGYQWESLATGAQRREELQTLLIALPLHWNAISAICNAGTQGTRHNLCSCTHHYIHWVAQAHGGILKGSISRGISLPPISDVYDFALTWPSTRRCRR